MALVDQLRRMTAVGAAQYSIGARAYWTDEDLGDVLAQHVSERLVQVPVELISSIESGGAIVAKQGQAEIVGLLDVESADLVDINGDDIEGATVHGDGRVEFATDQLSHVPLLSGLAYDLNAAAAHVLTDWASAVKEGYDVTLDGQQLKRAQRHEQLLKQAETFRSKAVIGSVRLRRGDGRRRNRRGRAVYEAFERLGRPGRRL